MSVKLIHSHGYTGHSLDELFHLAHGAQEKPGSVFQKIRNGSGSVIVTFQRGADSGGLVQGV